MSDENDPPSDPIAALLDNLRAGLTRKQSMRAAGLTARALAALLKEQDWILAASDKAEEEGRKSKLAREANDGTGHRIGVDHSSNRSSDVTSGPMVVSSAVVDDRTSNITRDGSYKSTGSIHERDQRSLSEVSTGTERVTSGQLSDDGHPDARSIASQVQASAEQRVDAR